MADALDRTCEMLARAAALFAVGGVAAGGAADGAGGEPVVRPPLRVGAAVDAIDEQRRALPRSQPDLGLESSS